MDAKSTGDQAGASGANNASDNPGRSPDRSKPHNPIVGYLTGANDLPVITTIEDAMYIQNLLRNPPRGSNTQRIEDIREAASEVIKRRSTRPQ